MQRLSRLTRPLLACLSSRQRAAKLGPVLSALKDGAVVLDVGVWCQGPEPHASENWLEKQVVGKGRLIALGLEDMAEFQARYPHVLCIQGDGRRIPLADGSVDIAVANAVLEHVPPDGQQEFVRQLARVARSWAMLAVPDRLCPVEVHTRIPFLHWTPFWRAAFKRLGRSYWASPASLNLFTMASLWRLLGQVNTAGYWRISRKTMLGMPVSLIALCRLELQSSRSVADIRK